jgi:predicted cation transporter
METRQMIGMKVSERIAVLETDMTTVKEKVSGLLQDVKTLQNRWALIMGGLMILGNIPNILQFLRHP